MPLAFVVAGGLARLVNAEFGIAEVGGALEQLAPLSACLAAGWALARVVKERFDAAEAARVASRQPARRLTLRDIWLGVERRLRGPPRVGR